MEFKQAFTSVFKGSLFVIVFFALGHSQIQGQTILRQSLSSFGGSSTMDGITIQSTVGQASSTTVVALDGTTLRQGFIQSPVRPIKVTEETFAISVYPNPSSGLFNIEMDFVPTDSYRVVNLLGQEVYSFTVQSESSVESFDLQEFPKGFYFLTVIRNNKPIHSQKLILTQ